VPSIEVNGLEISYRRAGEGPALFLAHGGGSDSREWRHQLEGLADELTVVAWDEPGAGGSSKPPEDFGLAGFADTLAGVIKALELAPAYVGGLSWGGVVALETYRRHPDVVSGLVLCDTYAGWKGSLPVEEVEARVAGVLESLEVPEDEFEPVIPGLFASDPNPEVVAELTRIEADATPASFRRLIAAIAECDLSDFLPRIVVPTLLIWGEEDARSPVDTVARKFHETIPDSELVVIPRAGHMSNMERPDEFNRAVLEFCRAHPQVDAEALAAAIVAALNARDLDALGSLAHPDIEFHSRLVALEGRVYRGHEGMAEYFRDIDAAFADATWELAEIVGWHGSDLVVELRTTARGHESGVPIDVVTPQVWSFREGKPWRNVTYSSRAEAVRAAGLAE
jgi:pimeloyl-ACP methyl ester carboxylesterase/ketosteroid isomerase-like protein